LSAAVSDNSVGQVINIGSGVQHTNEDIVRLVEEISGSRIKIDTKPFPPRRSDTDCWVADIALASDFLKWTPRTTLRDGIKKTFDWIKDHKHLYKQND